MKFIPWMRVIFLILSSNIIEEIFAINYFTRELVLYNICVFTVKIPGSNSQPTTPGLLKIKKERADNGLTEGIHSSNESTSMSSSSKNSFKKLLPLLISLRELEMQEKHLRRKKSVPNNNKKMPAHELRAKLKQLMANISNTFNDMDWYFALEQLENQTLHSAGENRKLKKYPVKKVNGTDEKSSDVFLDQFIKQMYEINPLFIEKIRSRIDEEISSNKRHIRLAPPSTDSIDDVDWNENKEQGLKKRTIVKSVQVKETIPAYSENEELCYECDTFTESNEDETLSESEESESNNKGRLVDDLYEIEPVGISNFSTTTTLSTTTLEAFYDEGDYYRENDEDYRDEKLKSIEEYEINKNNDELSTVETNEESFGVEGVSKIKGKPRRHKGKKGQSQLKRRNIAFKGRKFNKENTNLLVSAPH